jgi:DNA (cytosine-5)-methyltransferase 1
MGRRANCCCWRPFGEGRHRGVKYFDAFAGIGGFSLSLNEGGHECVGYSEIDTFAERIYRRHFLSHQSYGDIKKLNADSLPDFDLLVVGFPCQAFSIAGRRRGFADTRGTLFLELARILSAKCPGRFLFENAKGFCLTTLAALSKRSSPRLMKWQVLNSRHFGVPQNRERLFLVGHSRSTPRPKVFPFRGGDSGTSDENGERRRRTVVSVAIRGRHEGSFLEARGDQVANALRTGSGGSSKAMIALRGRRINNGFVRDFASIRRLTPVECERLQGFPDGWTAFGIDDTG